MRGFVALFVLLVGSIFLLARLGHYALWDDEAITALTAKGVWQTGDTSARIGDNVIAYRNGLLLRNMKDRATPPLQFYLSAPFLGWMGDTALAARLPFALCGLGCIGLLLWWMHRDGAPTIAWVLMGMAVLGNASFFLFSRQARYYGLSMLLSVALAYSYLHVRTRRGMWVQSALSVLLLAANYLAFAAVSVMLLVDYLLWGRRRLALRGLDWLIVLGPPMVLGAFILSIWNPLGIASQPRPQDFSWLQWHATLLWWNLRDLNFCEFGSGALLLAAPVVWVISRWQWLLRAILALVLGVVTVSILSPQNPSNVRLADVRYTSFLIPLCMAVGVLTLLPLARRSKTAALLIGSVAFGTNVLNFSFLTRAPARSTIYSYIGEIMRPVPEPYTPTAQWIRQHVKAGQSIVVVPDYMMYPLMFHAPHAVYGWQFTYPPPAEFASLDPIHFQSLIWPDYVVAFGVPIESKEANYELVHSIPVYYRDLYRPELFWRVFRPLPEIEHPTQGVLIYRRVEGPSFRL